MPAVSKKQERFMQAVAHSPKFAKKVGVPQSVGREFTKKEGGEMKESKKMMAKEVAFMKKKGAPKSMIKHEMKEAGMKRGGYAGGGNVRPSRSTGVASNKPIDFSKATPAYKVPLEEPVFIPKNPSATKQTRPTMASKTAKYAAGGEISPYIPKGLPVSKSFEEAQKKKLEGMARDMSLTPKKTAIRTMKAPTGRTSTYAAGGKIDPLAAQRSLATKGAQAPSIGPQSRLKPIGSNPRVAVDPKPKAVQTRTMKAPTGRMSMMKSGGLAAGHKAADGVAKKGRTSTTMVKMMRGGKAC